MCREEYFTWVVVLVFYYLHCVAMTLGIYTHLLSPCNQGSCNQKKDEVEMEWAQDVPHILLQLIKESINTVDSRKKSDYVFVQYANGHSRKWTFYSEISSTTSPILQYLLRKLNNCMWWFLKLEDRKKKCAMFSQ